MPYSIPDWLYYSDKKMGFTTTITGNFDADRFVESLPDYWIQEEAEKTRKKKTLVFTYPLYRNYIYSDRHNKALKEILEQLLKEGFALYAWHQGDAVSITEENINSFFKRKYKDIEVLCLQTSEESWGKIFNQQLEVGSENPEKIRKAMAKKGISADELMIIDYFEQRQLLADMSDFLNSNKVAYFDIKDFNVNDYYINDYDNNHFDEKNGAIFDQMMAIAQRKGKQFIKGIITNNDPFGSIKKICKKEGWKRIKASSRRVTDSNVNKKIIYEEIEEIDSYNEENIKLRETCKAVSLKSLKVGWLNSLPPELHKDVKLEELNIFWWWDKGSAQDLLIYLAKYGRHIKKLKLEMCFPTEIENIKKTDAYVEFITSHALENLEECILQACDLKGLPILDNTHKLKRFYSNTGLFDELHHNPIEELGGEMDELCLYQSLADHKNLKEVILINNSHLVDEQHKPKKWQGHFLPELTLEKLDLGSLAISPDFLYHILQRSKKLTVVDLTHVNKQLKEAVKGPRFEAFRTILIDRMDEKRLREQEEERKRLFNRQRSSHFQGLGSLFSRSSAGNQPGHRFHQKQTMGIDANTDPNDESTFHLERIFYAGFGHTHPHPSEYRLQAFQKIVVKEHALCLGEDPFLLTQDPPHLVDCPFPKWCQSEKEIIQARDAIRHTLRNVLFRKDPNRYYARAPIQLSEHWEPLPSYYADEKLTHFYVEGISSNELEFKRCQDQDFYYIRLKNRQPKEVIAHYVIEVPPLKPLPSFLSKMVHYYVNEFQPKALDHKGKTLITGQDYYRELTEQKCGACRHRSAIEMVKRQKEDPASPVQLIINGCHAYLEVRYQGYRYKCDLGGYPAKINIYENVDVAGNQSTPETNSTKTNFEERVIHQSALNPHFMTWESTKKGSVLLSDFTDKLLTKTGKNILLQAPSAAFSGYQLYLQEKCLAALRPDYYIDSPKDCVCSSRWIERHGNEGVLRKGPGGRLHQFLIENQDKQPIIIVNWVNFSPKEIANFNSIIDEVRKIDGTLIPKEALVVGLYDPHKPEAYRLSDLDSRFDEKIVLPFETKELQRFELLLLDKIASKEKDIEISDKIDLLNSAHWRAMLLGQWVLAGDRFTFKPGKLVKALEKGGVIEIANGPWHLPEFQLFWTQFLLHKAWQVYGETLRLAPKVKFVKSTGFDWKKLLKQIQSVNADVLPSVHVLNPTTLGQFITTYIEKDNKLFSCPGWLAAFQNQTMNIELTRNLTEEQWVRLLTECEKYKVTLQFIAKNWHQLPPAMKDLKVVTVEEKPIQKHGYGVQVHITNNVSMTKKALLQENPIRAVNISECKSSDLLVKHDVTWLDDISFRIQEQHLGILKALQHGESILLYGQFSQECIDCLAQFCIENAVLGGAFQGAIQPGKIYIVSNQVDAFPFANLSVHKLPEPPIGGHKDEENNKNFIENDLDLREETSNAFEALRLSQVKAGLNKAPSLLIEGPTGVGKTTFIFNTLKFCPEYAVYTGLANFHQWATDNRPGKEKVLFLDEANLANTDFSMFDGLYENPPFVYYEGELYPLSKNHKVVFAANRLSYGGERKNPTFFEDHPNAITFNALPAAVIYHRTLKPLFKKANDKVNELFLKVYQKIISLSKETVLMTPRELEMMAMAVQTKNLTPQLALKIAYLIGRSVLPLPEQKGFSTWFEMTFPDFKKSTLQQNIKVGDYLITHSRFEAYQLMSSILNIGDYQQTALQENQRFAGLAGMMIEGESAEGKSKFIIVMLKNHGFKEAPLDLNQPQAGKKFYHLPVGMSAKEKKDFFFKAFHEGCCIVIDEINSSEILEEALNAIAMGRDLSGNRARIAGMKLFATLNPIDYPGRRPISLAVKRRFVQCQFLPYDEAEIVDLLVDQGLPVTGAKLIARDYFIARSYALKHNLQPVPNFRNVKRAAKAYLEGKYFSVDYVARTTAPKKSHKPQVPPAPFVQRIKDYVLDIIHNPAKHPVALGMCGYIGVACCYGVFWGLTISLVLTMALQIRNLFHQYVEQSYAKDHPIIADEVDVQSPFADGLQAGNSWCYYFKSYASMKDWQHYDEFSAGMEYTFKEKKGFKQMN